jgi:Anaerobic ribonucleoside-triphosphate reductase
MFEVPDELKKYIGLKHLEKLPDVLKRFKCPICHAAAFTEPACPDCGNTTNILMCPIDHCGCHHLITECLAYCPICGEAMCPECGSHDVFQLSRVTGYIQDVSGWGKGKQQELKDRHRCTIATGKEGDVEL